MKRFYLFIFSIVVCATSLDAQELSELDVESLFRGLRMNIPEQIRFVNGLEDKRVWNYQPDIIQKFPDSIRNPDKIRFVSIPYTSAEDLQEAFQSLQAFSNLEYLEIKTATEFRKDHVKKELVLPEDLSGIKNLTFLNISGSYQIDFSRFFKRLKNLPDLEYFSFGHHFEDIILPDDFTELHQLKGLKFSGFKGLTLPEEMSKMANLSSIILYVEGFEDLSAELEKLARLPKLTSLSLRYVNFDPVKHAALGEMEDLETLEFVSSEFEDLQNLFDLLPEENKLKKLKLINLTTVKSPTDYSKLKSIEELVIQNMSDSNFEPAKDLFNLDNLKSLRIYESKNFSKVPPEIGKLKKLIHLSLYNNEIESFPPEIGELSQLKTLNIQHNSLTSLPPEIGDLHNLETIHMAGNDLVQIPKAFSNLVNLKRIDASGNDLKTLPENIGSLLSLQSFNLNQNMLQFLPGSITNLKYLTELHLSENDLLALPQEIGNLRMIEEMPLEGNFLEELPESFTSLVKLKTMNVSDNGLEKLPENIGDLKGLEQLYAGNSRNRRITNYTARGFVTDTTRKSRRKNDIKTLPESLSRLTQLKRLDFSELENIDSKNFFDVLFDLESKKYRLDLNNTGISTLPADGWENFKVEELILGGNVIPKVPDDIINAPYLDYLSLRRSKNDRMGYSYRGEKQLNAFFEEEGFITMAELPRTPAMAEAYLQNAYTKKYSGSPGDMLELMNKAFALDSGYTAKSIRKDAYAEALMAGEAYHKAIKFFTQAIQRDTASRVRILNFTVPLFEKRAEAYLSIGDTLSAINDLQVVSRKFSAGNWGEAGLLAKKINEDSLATDSFQSGLEDYERQIQWNKENERVNYGVQLSKLELLIIAEEFEKAKNYYIQLLKEGITGVRNEYLLKYFGLIIKAIEGDLPNTEIEQFRQKVLDEEISISGWSFELFRKWLYQTELPQEKVSKMAKLTDILENQA